MKSKNPNAVALGRLGGKKKSERKTLACRENGKKGGRAVREKAWQEHQAWLERDLSPAEKAMWRQAAREREEDRFGEKAMYLGGPERED